MQLLFPLLLLYEIFRVPPQIEIIGGLGLDIRVAKVQATTTNPLMGK
jgi:hypothetical protein